MNYKIQNYSSLKELLNEQVNFSKSASLDKSDDVGISSSSGSHLYCDLRVTQQLTSSSILEEREQGMGAIKELGKIALEAVNIFGGQLLEHQGQRIHLFFEGGLEDMNKTAYASAIYIDLQSRKRINQMIPTKWKGFVSSIAWGHTVFLRATDLHGDDSIISLSHAANAPAKALSSVKDGEIIIVKGEIGGHKKRELVTEEFKIMAKSTSEHLIKNRATRDFQIQFSAQEDFIQARQQSNFPKKQETATNEQLYFSYVFRADLDGFTKAVLNAQQNLNLLNQLVSDFVHLIKQANTFAREHIQEFVQLPWAGDCYSLVVTSRCAESYRLSLSKSNIDLCVEFNENVSLPDGLKQSDLSGWAYSIAGGDVHGAQHGNCIVERLHLDDRSFIVATGLGIRRSLDAFEQIEVDNQQIALFKEDKKHLTESYEKYFKEQNSNFVKASINQLNPIKTALKATTPATVSSTVLPPVSNYYEEV